MRKKLFSVCVATDLFSSYGNHFADDNRSNHHANEEVKNR